MVNYRDIYTSTFVSAFNQSWTVSILRRGWKKLASTMKAGVDPYGIDYPEIDDREDIKNVFHPTRGSNYLLELVSSEKFSLKSDLYTEDTRKFQIVEKFEGSDSWKGWLNPDLSEEPYGEMPYYIKLGGRDDLKQLEEKTFVDDKGKGFVKPITLVSAIASCLSKTDLSLEFYTACDIYGAGHDQSKDSLIQLYLQPGQFVNDEDEPKDCLTVLAAILESFGLIIYQENASWYLVQPQLFASDTIRFFRYKADGTALGQSSLSTAARICDHGVPTKRDRRLILKEGDPTTALLGSLKKITLTTEYGTLKNHLFNPRFRDLDPTRTGGKIARGWRQYNSTYSYVEPNPAPVFEDKYLRIEGKKGRDLGQHTGITYVWSKSMDDFRVPPYASLQTPYASFDKQLHISAPAVARYDQVIKVSGEYFNAGGKGIKIQVVAVPLVNTTKVISLRLDPNTYLSPEDEKHLYPLFLTEEGEWQYVSIPLGNMGAVLVYDNLKEKREGDKLVNVAKEEWASFEIESKPLPLVSPYEFRSTYYTIRVIVFRVVEYEEDAPKNPGPAYVEYRNLKTNIRDYLDTDDIRKEKLVLTQNGVGGKEWKNATISLGSVGGNQYNSQLLGADSEPVTRFTRGGLNENRSLAQCLATLWINQYRKSPLEYSLTLLGKNVKYGYSYFLENDRTPLHVTRAVFNRRSGKNKLSLVEILKGDVGYSFQRYNVNQNGKSIKVEEGVVEGTVVENEGDLFFTFFEPNGKSGNKIAITGSAWSAYPNSTIQLPAHYFTIAWHDALDDGPYQVIVESFLHGQGLGDYQKIYETSDMFATVEVSGDNTAQSLKIRVRTASGQEIQRPAIVTTQQELQLTDVGRSCVGDFPAVSAVLKNSKPPVIVKIPLSTRVFNLSPALYYAEVVNLATGEVVFATAKGSVIPSQTTLGIVVQMPEEWNSGLYGFRIIDGSFGADRCGIITEITRCKAKPPLRFNHEFTPEFYQEEVPG